MVFEYRLDTVGHESSRLKVKPAPPQNRLDVTAIVVFVFATAGAATGSTASPSASVTGVAL